MEIWSLRTSDDTKIRITIRLVGEMERVDQRYLQFFNIIMRKCLALLNLQLVGRDYFDAHSKVNRQISSCYNSLIFIYKIILYNINCLT